MQQPPPSHANAARLPAAFGRCQTRNAACSCKRYFCQLKPRNAAVPESTHVQCSVHCQDTTTLPQHIRTFPWTHIAIDEARSFRAGQKRSQGFWSKPRSKPPTGASEQGQAAASRHTLNDCQSSMCACITSLSSSCTSCHTRRSMQQSVQPSMQQSMQLHMCQQPVAAQHASTLLQTTVLHVAAALHGCCVCPAVIEKNRPSPASTHQVIVEV